MNIHLKCSCGAEERFETNDNSEVAYLTRHILDWRELHAKCITAKSEPVDSPFTREPTDEEIKRACRECYPFEVCPSDIEVAKWFSYFYGADWLDNVCNRKKQVNNKE